MRYAYEMFIDDESCKSIGFMMAKLGDSEEDGVGTTNTTITSSNNLTSSIRLVGERDREVLKFKVSFAKIVGDKEMFIDANDRDRLDFWLTHKYGFRKIKFIQPDMMDKYYMGKVNNIQWKSLGNQTIACEFEIETDSPYGHKDDEIEVFNFTTALNTIQINNISHGDRWTYPKIKITMNTTGSDVKIKNITDKGREFVITGLVANEVLEVDCKTGKITSSTLLNKKGSCNLVYPRLAYGLNELQVIGNVKILEVVYKNDVRIGG
ncbi:MAG: phage tail domain-containing protein [Peptostreptococcaceae bacterium]